MVKNHSRTNFIAANWREQCPATLYIVHIVPGANEKGALSIDLNNDEVPPALRAERCVLFMLPTNGEVLLDCLSRKGVLVVDWDKLKDDNEDLMLIETIEMLRISKTDLSLIRYSPALIREVVKSIREIVNPGVFGSMIRRPPYQHHSLPGHRL
ncbi:MAG: hypothetical protein OXC07_01555 [Kistimonas sp.]|nr:hypothetical protein [Kistimonas sp.]